MRNLSDIRRKLARWYAVAGRKLPWRETRNPYRIWVSEIMLQQTRVAAVIPYYKKFLERFPDVPSLARAREEELLSAWSGLGYYSRARNLQKAAEQIVERGRFPRDYESIRQLAGVGDYTAAAVASIAYDLPSAVLDGNVLRVLSRLTNEKGDIRSSTVRKRLQEAAEKLLDRRHPGRFNQALMELGATVCLPREPRCLLCPVSESCQAQQLGTQNELPVKLRRRTPIRVEKTLLLVHRNGSLLMWKRTTGPKLKGFWELPEAEQLPVVELGRELGEFRHSITNHNYVFTLVAARVRRIPKGFSWISRDRCLEIPLSTTTKKALACSKV
jgi:A/G-specific adenine glycosylase